MGMFERRQRRFFGNLVQFDARLFRKGEEAPEIKDQATADGLVADLDGTKYIVKSVGTKEKRRNPVAPFITSTLQQEASRKLRFSVNGP